MDFDKFKIKLVEDWKQCLKWFSMQCMVLAATIQVIWETMPVDLKSNIPPSISWYATLGFLFAGMLGRVIDQKPKEEKTE